MIQRTHKVFRSRNFGECESAVILLHGYGSDAETFAYAAERSLADNV
ncbi:MAG: hypothetical protein LBF65_01625 [Holosporales bacterium]|jgi:predicted esterase|nr:hypothetical protein [Holosporales bacterium]